MTEKRVKPSIAELEAKVKNAQGRFELLKLKEEITTLITGPESKELSQEERDQLEDLLAKALAKEEQFRGCDPFRVILRPPVK